MRDKILGVVKGLDRGFYHAAKADEKGPRASYGFLMDMIAALGLAPTEAELDRRTKRILLSCGYKDPETVPALAYETAQRYAWDSWGLEKALESVGIKTKGSRADTLEKFFGTTSSTILFPAYVESQVIQGLMAASLVGMLCATETNIDSHTYQALRMNDAGSTMHLGTVGEGAELPKVTIATAEGTIRLWKFGRLLEATYESLRLARLNVVGIHLQRMGRQVGIDETDWLIETLILGDGNTGSAVVDTDAEVGGTLDYDELVRLDLAFPVGYEMSDCVVNATNLRTILNMAEFKDPMAGFTFQRTGALPGPMGADWHRWDSTNSTAFSTDRILAVDSRYAAEQITEQGVMTESDRLIDKQFERTAITKWTGFAKIDYNATQCLDIS